MGGSMRIIRTLLAAGSAAAMLSAGLALGGTAAASASTHTATAHAPKATAINLARARAAAAPHIKHGKIAGVVPPVGKKVKKAPRPAVPSPTATCCTAEARCSTVRMSTCCSGDRRGEPTLTRRPPPPTWSPSSRGSGPSRKTTGPPSPISTPTVPGTRPSAVRCIRARSRTPARHRPEWTRASSRRRRTRSRRLRASQTRPTPRS